ncbi:MAG: hypothetical protein U0984_13315 [Prosthecobacter sp.]|nr:hypothetical protein [Prosthecobacter sp.]
MQTITTTISVGDDATSAIATLLKQFPRGSRVRLALSPLAGESGETNVTEYRDRVAKARRQFAAKCPWTTTAEAIRDLREGEQD